MPSFKKRKYEYFSVSADILVFRRGAKSWEILLIQRKNPPYQSCWALPGGFIDRHEDSLTCAKRELKEETHLVCDKLFEFGAFTAPGRDPRGRTATVAYYTFLTKKSGEPQADDDAEALKWFPLRRLPELAFDHKEIISKGIKAARAKLR